MTHIDDAALDELARLAGEATPGPWTVTGCTRGADWVCSNRGCLTNTEDGTFRPANAAYIAAADPSTVAALVGEVRRLRAALAPFAEYARQNDRKPLRMQGDVIHAIHTGTEWEAELSLSDCRAARAALDGGQ